MESSGLRIKRKEIIELPKSPRLQGGLGGGVEWRPDPIPPPSCGGLFLCVSAVSLGLPRRVSADSLGPAAPPFDLLGLPWACLCGLPGPCRLLWRPP